MNIFSNTLREDSLFGCEKNIEETVYPHKIQLAIAWLRNILVDADTFKKIVNVFGCGMGSRFLL